jgi:hypothetical protein
VKTDDDVFINVFNLQTYIFSLYSTGLRSRLVTCLVWSRVSVKRTGKWAVSKADISTEFYPDYCAGLAYVQTGDVIRAFYRISLRVPFFWIDDIYVTGQLVKALSEQVLLTDINKLYRLVITRDSDVDQLHIHR